MADGSVIIKVEMNTDGVKAGVDDIREGCGRAAAAAERAGRSMTRTMAGGTKSMTLCGESVKHVGTQIRTACRKLRDGMNTMTAQNGRVSTALEQMRGNLNGVQQSLASAFAPVVTAAAPLLTKLCELVANAANYVAGFFAVLGGGNNRKNAVKAQNAITDSVTKTGKAARETARNLSGLDELNIWKVDRSGGGYGGGSGGDIDLGTGEPSSFIIRLKDIFFEWKNLNPELIAEKILTGLCAVAGGIIGWKLGGPLGGLVGLTMGALLGVKLSEVSFNGDGKINKSEAGKLVIMAVLGLLGGIAGAMIGGPAGAAIGFLVGAGVSVLIGKALFDGEGKMDGNNAAGSVLKALMAIIGGVLGFVIGGPRGAAVGFTVGAGVSVLLQNAETEAKGGVTKWVRKKIFEPIKKGLKTAGVLAVTVAVSLVKKLGQWAADAWNAVKDGALTVNHKATTSLARAGAWVAEAWDAVKDGPRTVEHKATASLSKGSAWAADAWTVIQTGGKILAATLKASVVDATGAATKNVRSVWDTVKDKTATLTAKAKNSASGVLGTLRSAWSAVSSKTSTLTAKAVNGTGSTLTTLKSAWDSIKSKTVTLTAKILTSATSALRKLFGLSTGGIYKNGKWEPIEGYASGGNPRSARLFYANENGMPELVGRIGSSTAVMNNGQIVASVAAGVYRAVAAAFGQIGGWFSAMTARLGDIPPAIEMLANMPRQVPQPVMATGTVLPPKAVYVDGPVQGLADAVEGLRDALDRRDPDRSGTRREPAYNVSVNVDGRQFLRLVLEQGRLRQLQSGGNPFMDLMGG